MRSDLPPALRRGRHEPGPRRGEPFPERSSPTRLSSGRRLRGEGWGGALRKQASARSLVAFTRAAAVMVAARLPLVEAVETAAQSGDAVLRGAGADVVRRLRKGESLSGSLARHPEAFDVLFVRLIAVGEATGQLDTILLQLADYLEKREALKRRVRMALVYPAVVLSVAVAAVTFLLTVIVPTFAEMFADFGAELPGPTLAVLAVSGFLRANALPLALGLVVAGVFARYALTVPGGRRLWDVLKLKMPVLGAIYRNALTARFCRTLGTLLDNGVPLTESLESAAETVDNVVLREAALEMRRQVIRGSRLAAPLAEAGVFPPMVTRMITVGEETARLSEMMAHVARHVEQEVDGLVDTLTSLIEPVLIIVLGVVIGAILVAIYLPMFELTNVIR